jgi:hypothetical protein
MNGALFNRLRTYIEAITVARRLLKAGLISQDEFLFIEEQTALMCDLPHRSIFREIT